MFLNNFGATPGGNVQISLMSDSSNWCIIKDNLNHITRNVSLHKGMNTFNFSKNIKMGRNIVEKKSLIIETPAPAAVFALNYRRYSTDGYFAFPTRRCSTRYIIPSFKPVNSIFDSVIGIGGLHNDTLVTVSVRLESGAVALGEHPYYDGDVINITLQEYETFQMANWNDLTGSKIQSSRPVCVVSGTGAAKVEGVYGSHLSEMVLPVEAYSYVFIIPELYTRSESLIRVIPKDNYTSLMINTHPVSLKFERFHQFTAYSEVPNIISSDKPVLVMLYAKEVGDKLGDPFMVTVPGITQYLSRYNFVVPDAGFTNYISIIVRESDLSGLRLDDTIVFPIEMSKVFIDNDGDLYVTFIMYILPGGYTMRHITGNKFALFVYGNSLTDGYGFHAGLAFTNLL